MVNFNKTLHKLDKALHQWGNTLHEISEQLLTVDDFLKLEPDTR
ncbi:MAG: hypothetical protein RLZZ148_2177, partial [Cyanobacteriota bacterium]